MIRVHDLGRVKLVDGPVQRLVGALKLLLSEGVGILLVEQFTEIALSLATDAIVMRGGKVHFSGPAAELQAAPERLDKAYFG